MFYIWLLIICILIFSIYWIKPDKKIELETLESTYYLIHFNNYDFSNFLRDMGLSYKKYITTNTWRYSFQQAMIDTYVLYFDTNILPKDTQTFIDNTIDTISKVVTDDHADVSNWITYYTVNFTPTIPTSYHLYTYQTFDQRSYYTNLKLKNETIYLKDVVDLKKNIYITSDLITLLDQSKTYINTISTTPINLTDIRLPIQYTYFDPLDIYLNPNKYVFSGMGITDLSQPEYILSVDKNQFPFLNRLL